MKHLYALIVLPLLFGGGKVMAANGTTTDTHDNVRTLSVFVRVDDRGHVTKADPTLNLKPAMQRLLKQTLDELITKPAHDAHGKAIPSQFVARMKMQPVKRKDGKYDFKFAYVSAQPVPPGQWVWSHDQTARRVTLVNQSMISNSSDQIGRAKRSAMRQAAQRRHNRNVHMAQGH